MSNPPIEELESPVAELESKLKTQLLGRILAPSRFGHFKR
jgi:hypothetical protein